MHCTERRWAVPSSKLVRRRRVPVRSGRGRAFWVGGGGEQRCGFTGSSCGTEKNPQKTQPATPPLTPYRPSRGFWHSSMARPEKPRLTAAWLIMTAHAWVTVRRSRAALPGNTVMWNRPGRQQLLDMFPRAKSGYLSVFELVLFLSALSGCPTLTSQARSKGRWNKGGKWWWAAMTHGCHFWCGRSRWSSLFSEKNLHC